MNSGHDSSHEALLQALLTGELEHDSPAAAAARGCAECRQRLERMGALAGRLTAMGREQREILAEASRMPALPEEELIPGLVEELRPRPRLWPWVVLGMAAAVVLAVALALFVRGSDIDGRPPRDDTMLGGPKTPGEAYPQGDVEVYGPFGWPAAQRLPGQRYLVRVYSPDRPTPVLESRLLDSESWSPDPERLRPWASIQWEVVVVDADGSPTGTTVGRWSASRR